MNMLYVSESIAVSDGARIVVHKFRDEANDSRPHMLVLHANGCAWSTWFNMKQCLYALALNFSQSRLRCNVSAPFFFEASMRATMQVFVPLLL